METVHAALESANNRKQQKLIPYNRLSYGNVCFHIRVVEPHYGAMET